MGKTKKLQKRRNKKGQFVRTTGKKKEKAGAKKEKRVVLRTKNAEKTPRGYWA